MSNDERTSLLAPDSQEAAYNTANQTSERGEIAHSSNAETSNTSVMAFFAATSGCILLAALDSTIVTTAFARIGSDMNQLQRASWIATSYMISLTAFQPLYGKLSDIFGRKSCLLFAHLVFGVGCLTCAMANDITGLILARMVSGIGGAGFMPLVTIAISDIVPLRQRGTWQGVINLISTVGTAGGAPLGGVIVDKFGWRWGFAVQVPVCLVGFMAIWFAFPNNSKSNDVYRREVNTFTKLRQVDFLGSLLIIVIVFTLLLGLDKGSNVAWTSPITCISFAISILGTIILVLVESNPSLAKESVAPTRFFKNRNLVASYMTSLWLMSVGSSTVYQLALYAQVLSRKSASQASVYLLPTIIALVIGHLAGGILTQKLGKFRVLMISAHVGGFMFACLGVVMVVFRYPSWDLIALTSCMTILSFFGGVSSTTRLVAVIASVGPSDRAAATSLSFLFKTLGTVFGLSLCNALLQQVLRIVLARELSGFVYDIDEIIHHVRESLTFIDSLDPSVQDIVRQSYSKALVVAFKCNVLQSALCLFSSLFIRDRPLDSPN